MNIKSEKVILLIVLIASLVVALGSEDAPWGGLQGRGCFRAGCCLCGRFGLADGLRWAPRSVFQAGLGIRPGGGGLMVLPYWAA